MLLELGVLNGIMLLSSHINVCDKSQHKSSLHLITSIQKDFPLICVDKLLDQLSPADYAQEHCFILWP